MKFRDIEFGYASAETEFSRAPELLKDGYLDLNDACKTAMHGEPFLFLGYKGSGKSAIGERIKLLTCGDPNCFVKQIQLGDFPFNLFSKIIRGESEPESKYPIAWAWILLIYILESFSKDAGALHADDASIKEIMVAFGKMGLCPVRDAKTIVRTSAKTRFKLSIPEIFEATFGGSQLRPASEIPLFVESLKDIICGFSTESKHYLIIDGLDDILTSKEVQYTSLGSLVYEIDRLNNLFIRHGVQAKIILLCRTDVFERISGANKNKIRRDSAVEINWYHDTRQPENSMLLAIANLRAQISLRQEVNIFQKFIVNNIDGGDPRKYLLEMTRHTPRDFLQLLKCIQEFSKGAGEVTLDQMKSGVRKYSIDYFLPEIRDELSGYASSEEADSIFDIISFIKKRDFRYDDLLSAAKGVSSNMDENRIGYIFKAMFECGAIGNIQHRPTGTTYYTFKYRNRQSVFKKNEGVMLHRGLWKALNLV